MRKSIMKMRENYVAKIPLAVLNYEEYLIENKKIKPRYARERSLQYGKRMLESDIWRGMPLESKAEFLKNCSTFYIQAAELCEELSSWK